MTDETKRRMEKIGEMEADALEYTDDQISVKNYFDSLREIEKLKAENSEMRFELEAKQRPLGEQVLELTLDNQKLKAELEEAKAENKNLQNQMQYDQEYSRPDELLLNQINTAARNSYRRSQSGAKGQMITASDSFENHIIWAALASQKSQLTAERATSAELSEMFCDLYTEKFENRIDWPGDSFHDFLGKYEALFEKTVAAHNARQKERG